MATLKEIVHRKNAEGQYDEVYFKSSSDIIFRPSGRTVEQDLNDYLPQVQETDDVPEILQKGKIVTNNKRPYVNINGTVDRFIVEDDNPLVYDIDTDLPPFEGIDADTLDGKHADEFLLKSDTDIINANVLVNYNGGEG